MAGECVQCGYCCATCACPYGIWDKTRHSCVYLVDDPTPGSPRRLCARYDEIRLKSEAEMCPAFGAGCSSTLATTRRKATLAWQLRKGIQQ